MDPLKKLARAEAKKAQKELNRIEAEKNQKPVNEITITIEWRKSRMWGNNPFCMAFVRYEDGSSDNSPIFTASGCGYDKESTVIADVFNNYLKYKLYSEDILKAEGRTEQKPYGITASKEWKYFDGGIGTSCYYAISKAIGGLFEHVASGKTFDVYKYTDTKK